ncbi:MAG: nicotinamide riboside transporter PnuC [Chitinophagaceae bacterium]|nr:nicotinamide riboside transporter PnuC [Chitinophagaceae bacterium]
MVKQFFSVHTEFFHLLNYSMSYLEFFGVIFGLLAVWLSARAVIWTWPVGLLNIVLAFILYYQVQLYPDMFLQSFFFVTNLVGWWRWAHPKPGEENRKQQLKVSFLKKNQLVLTLFSGIGGTLILGKLASGLHQWLPAIFPLPSAYPYVDSFILVMSVIATFFVIQKKIESWIIWIAVDIVATLLYFIKGVKFYSLEYFIFTLIAGFGLWHWIREYKSYPAADQEKTLGT